LLTGRAKISCQAAGSVLNLYCKNLYRKETTMQKFRIFLTSGVLIAALALGACAPKVGQADYNASSVRGIQHIHYGTVLSVRKVHIADNSGTMTTLGTLGGGVAGGVLGSLFGHGSGRVVAATAGALAGALLGYGGATALSGQDGYEITVHMDNGEMIAVTQGTDAVFHAGERVKVLSGSSGARVTPL
jgi:outer membrane lipoprotein SlyB